MRTRSTTFKQNGQARTESKDNIFLKPKDDRTYGERVDVTVWEDSTGAKAIRKRRSQDGSNAQLLGAIAKRESEENANRGRRKRPRVS